MQTYKLSASFLSRAILSKMCLFKQDCVFLHPVIYSFWMRIQQDCCGWSPMARAAVLTCRQADLLLLLVRDVCGFFTSSRAVLFSESRDYEVLCCFHWCLSRAHLIFICSFLACIHHFLVWVYIEVVPIKSVHLYSFQYPVREINPCNGSNHSTYCSYPCSFSSRWTVSLLHYHIKLTSL